MHRLLVQIRRSVATVNTDPRITNSEFAVYFYEFVVMQSYFLLMIMLNFVKIVIFLATAIEFNSSEVKYVDWHL